MRSVAVPCAPLHTLPQSSLIHTAGHRNASRRYASRTDPSHTTPRVLLQHSPALPCIAQQAPHSNTSHSSCLSFAPQSQVTHSRAILRQPHHATDLLSTRCEPTRCTAHRTPEISYPKTCRAAHCEAHLPHHTPYVSPPRAIALPGYATRTKAHLTSLLSTPHSHA